MITEMDLDKKLKKLPLTKANPKSLLELFGKIDIIPMWVADMEFEVAKPIQEALKERVSNSGFGYEYKPESFFAAQKEWYTLHYDIELIKTQTFYSPSITTTMAVVIENFTSENDGVIIQPPVFMEFKDVIRKTKRNIIKNPLKLVDAHYEIDFEDLAKKAKVKNNKILIICNPHNPIGRVWTKKELIKIVDICKENNLILISDEVHKDIVLFDHKFTSILHFQKTWLNTIVCTSEAKTFNLPGISDSMMIIPNEHIRNSVFDTFKKYNLGKTNALTRIAFETAYTKGDPWLKDLIQTIERNVRTVENELKKSNSKIGLIRPEGTYQIWLDFRGLFEDSIEMFNYITKHSGIGMNAGHWFGREGALFMRMNIATSNEKVLNAIRSIIKAAQLCA